VLRELDNIDRELNAIPRPPIVYIRPSPNPVLLIAFTSALSLAIPAAISSTSASAAAVYYLLLLISTLYSFNAFTY
jgi:hypothetical protein